MKIPDGASITSEIQESSIIHLRVILKDFGNWKIFFELLEPEQGPEPDINFVNPLEEIIKCTLIEVFKILSFTLTEISLLKNTIHENS